MLMIPLWDRVNSAAFGEHVLPETGASETKSKLNPRAASGQRSSKRDEDYGTYEGDDDATDQPHAAAGKQHAENEAANESTDDAQHDVADQPVAAALHELPRKESVSNRGLRGCC